MMSVAYQSLELTPKTFKDKDFWIGIAVLVLTLYVFA